MPLCNICKSIPFRRIITGDESLPVAPPKNGGIPTYHVRSYDSIPQLLASGKSCPLCNTIAKSLESSYWYQSMMQDQDRSIPVWLCLPVGSWSPGIWTYLGDDMPETKIFGNDVQIYTTMDGVMAEHVRSRYVHESPTHEHALKQIEMWLDACASRHPQCSRVAGRETELPKRVLDLGALPGREEMVADKSWRDLFHGTKCSLVENSTKHYGRYVALSYCWGTTLAYKTTKDNIERHMQGIEFSRLPKTLQDAIYVTRYVGVRYIWIDCLCIVQDDKADWQKEAACMSDVYSNSWLTIAAARAGDSSDGFLGSRKIRAMDLVSFEDDHGPFQLHFYGQDVSASPGSVESVSLEPLRSEPLSKRVWTLQERLLAARTLHFATGQMYWECGEISQCEDGNTFGSGDQDFRLHDIVEGLQSTSPSDSTRWLWYQLIQAFTSRSMTYQSDKLPAISGVVAAIQRQTNDGYYAGIWQTHFLAGLLWRLEDPDLDLYVFAPKQPQKLDFWRAPSWSFAAVEGVVRYDLQPFETHFCAELMQCYLAPSGENPLGELEAGFARIRGPVASIERVGRERTSEGYTCYLRLRDNELIQGNVFFDFERREDGEVLMLTPYLGLAIALVDGSQDRYLRVGVVQARKDPDGPPLSASQYQEPVGIMLL